MHGYLSDNFFRGPKVYFSLGFLAIYASSFSREWLSSLPLLDYFGTTAVSAGVIYSILIVFYEYIGWKWISTIRNLNGTWAGTIATNYDGGTKLNCVLRVRQTWTRMTIELETDKSRSHTTMSAFYENQPGDVGLKYEFVSEPKYQSVETMHTHRGVCTLAIEQNNSALKMSGNYFTSRGRKTHGEISLIQVSSKVLSYESALRMMKR